MDSIDEFDNANSRPQFLQILCILSFIGGAMFIIRSAVLYVKADNISNFVSGVKIKEQDSSVVQYHSKRKEPIPFKNFLDIVSKMTTKDGIRKTSIWTIISSVITVLGAWLMWRLKKAGYFVYIFGTLIGLLFPVFFFGANGTTIASGIFSQFVGLIFIALYALNYKSLQ